MLLRTFVITFPGSPGQRLPDGTCTTAHLDCGSSLYTTASTDCFFSIFLRPNTSNASKGWCSREKSSPSRSLLLRFNFEQLSCLAIASIFSSMASWQSKYVSSELIYLSNNSHFNHSYQQDIYYLSFPNDRRMTKATVAFVYAVGTLQTAFALRDFYTLFCIPDNNEDPTAFYKIWDDLRPFGFMWITIPLSGASGTLLFHSHSPTRRPHRIRCETVAAVSQLFYAHRIHVLSGKKLIPGIVIVVSPSLTSSRMFSSSSRIFS
jgi:hypothetical protein